MTISLTSASEKTVKLSDAWAGFVGCVEVPCLVFRSGRMRMTKRISNMNFVHVLLLASLIHAFNLLDTKI